MVSRSSGYSPATPRMPSVPNSCFPKESLLLSLHHHAYDYLLRCFEPHVRIVHKRVDSELRGAHHARNVHWIGDRRRKIGHPARGTHHAKLRRCDFIMRHLVSMRALAAEAHLHRNASHRTPLEFEGHLRWNRADQADASRQFHTT